MAPASISWLTSECSDSVSPKTAFQWFLFFSGLLLWDVCIVEEVRLAGVLIQETTDSEQFWVSCRTGYELRFCHLPSVWVEVRSLKFSEPPFCHLAKVGNVFISKSCAENATRWYWEVLSPGPGRSKLPGQDYQDLLLLVFHTSRTTQTQITLHLKWCLLPSRCWMCHCGPLFCDLKWFSMEPLVVLLFTGVGFVLSNLGHLALADGGWPWEVIPFA